MHAATVPRVRRITCMYGKKRLTVFGSRLLWAMAADTFMCVLLYFVSALLSSIEVFAQLRSCSPGTFCPIDANCTSNTNLCTVVCPTETDHMQQGNHLTGNCERSKLKLCVHEWATYV